jgi:Fe2+ or Zn2+ uptake regulation protein
VFEYLLLIVDHKTGTRDTGRYWIANDLEMNPNTVYAALQRLKNAKMITLTSNNKYSTIYICKWKEYQSDDNTCDNNKITSGQQQDNTKQELRIKNKEEYIHSNLKITKNEYELLKEKFSNKNVKLECEKANDWLANTRKTYKDYSAFMRNWLRRAPVTQEVKKDTFFTKYAKELARDKSMS